MRALQEYYLNVLVAPPRSEQSKLTHVLDSGAVRALQNLVRARSLCTANAPCQAGPGMYSQAPALIITADLSDSWNTVHKAPNGIFFLLNI